jgi:hypothetical protein
LATILESTSTMDFPTVPKLTAIGWNILAKTAKTSRAKTSAGSLVRRHNQLGLRRRDALSM